MNIGIPYWFGTPQLGCAREKLFVIVITQKNLEQ